MVLNDLISQEFPDRLRQAMHDGGYAGYGATSKLAKDLGITPKAVAKWVQGLSMPNFKRLGELAWLLKVDPEWLLWGEDKEPFRKKIGEGHVTVRQRSTSYKEPGGQWTVLSSTPPSQNPIEEHPDVIQISVWDDETPLDDDEVEVPFLREVELSAGSGRTVIQESSRAKLRFGKLTLRKHSVQFDQAVCVPVHGNSMEPVLPDGSTVAINKGATAIVDGKIYAIAHAGQLRVKTLYRLPGGGVRFRSFNQAEHKDEEYTAQQMIDQEIVILGKVFWSAAFH